MVRLLLARGADVNLGHPPIVMACCGIQEEYRKYVIMIGCWDRKYEIVQELLKNGANVHVTSPLSGKTPLQVARGNKQPKIVSLLLEHIKANRI